MKMIDFKQAFIDAAPFIYFIEKDSNNPQYYKKVKDFFKYINMFNRFVETTDMEVVEINQEIAKKAAQIRAEYKSFKAMDAFQLAVACLSKCDLFLSNDKQLKRFKEIKCITVDELD